MFSPKIRSLALITLLGFTFHTISSIFLATFADNTGYYVDATLGNDTNDGLAPGTAWQTLSRANAEVLLPGDQINLKCGETWSESLMFDESGISGNEIQVLPYGTCSASSFVTLNGTGAESIYIGSGASFIQISGITFAGGTGVTLDGANEVRIGESIFRNTTGPSITTNGTNTIQVENNLFSLGGTGSTQVGLSLENDSGISITGNTFSGGLMSVDMKNGDGFYIVGNTFYNPEQHAISIVENSNVAPGKVQSNDINSNTILTWNPSYSMIHIDDQNDALGTLASLDGNTYLQVYKLTSSLVDILASGTGTINYGKDEITTLDTGAIQFDDFGYSSYIGNETRLLVNTGSISVNRACPGGTDCLNMVTTAGVINPWPVSVAANSSEIVLWSQAPNTVYTPNCTFNTSSGSIANGESTVLSWAITNSTTRVLVEPTATGGTTESAIPAVGSGTYYPPMENSVNNYAVRATNIVGEKVCTAAITTQNFPPTLSTFIMTGSEDSATITGTLVATDGSGQTITYYKFPDAAAQAAHGTITVAFDSGLVTYTPDTNFCGIDTFEWYARDDGGSSSLSQFGSIDVQCVNDDPIAVDDTVSATGGSIAILDVTTNDTDVDSPYTPQTYTVSGMTLPLHGTLIQSGSLFEYEPSVVYLGTDSFTYVAIDQSGAISNTATVNINVAPGYNIPPNISSGSFMLSEDSSIADVFSGSDANGDTLTFSAATLPSYGTVTIVGSGFTYTPDANYNGTDSFDFIANDGTADSSGATITFTITSVADAPVAVADTINIEMNTVTSIDALVNDTDADEPYQAQVLTITGISMPSHGTAAIIANRVEYTPDTNYLGSDSIDYTIVDQDGNISNTATINIDVTTTNQDPNAEGAVFNINEDIPLSSTLSGSDPDGTPVSFVVDTDVSNGTLVLSSTGEFTYTPDANYNGTDSFTFHVSDGIFISSTQTVTINIAPLNDSPIANADSFTVDEDGTLDTTPLSNDSDPDVGDVFSLSSVTPPLHGTATITGNLITYTPTADYCGADTFEYILVDLSGATSNVGPVSMTVTCINDMPTATGSNYTATGNIMTQSGNILYGTLSGADIDGDSLTYTITTNVSNGVLTLTGNAFSYEPVLGFTGSDFLIFTADDGTLTSTSATVNINVIPNTYNAIPVAYGSGYTTDEDIPLSGMLSGSDLENAPLTYTIDQTTTSGTLVIASSGTFTYTPNTNYNGTDSFTFHVSDGVNISSTVTGSITINAVNDAPIAVADTLTGAEDTQATFNPTLNDTDVEGDNLMLMSYSTGTNGTVNASGNVMTYSPSANFCGSDTISYAVVDTSAALSNTGTISITITCTNDAPVGIADTATGTEDTVMIIPVLSNDTDVEGDTLSIASIMQPSTGGTIQISGTGIQFTPTPNYCTPNPITFSYIARDPSNALSASTLVTINEITCINDTPTSIATSFSMTGNVVINSGTMLSGGTLTGYIESTNTLIRTLSATDIEGDTITFSAATLPTHGTFTLSVTGAFTYMPTVSYIGTDSFSYAVTDGTGTSMPITVTLVIQDPNPVVVVVTGPTVGAGGGGGGGGGSSYASIGSIYSQVTASPGTSTELTSQLLLGNPNMQIPMSGTASMNTPVARIYESLITPIAQIIETSKVEPTTSRARAVEIRKSGQKLMHSITKSLVLAAAEKSEVLKSTESTLQDVYSQGIPKYESSALSYIIRLVKRERMKIKKNVNIVGYLLSI